MAYFVVEARWELGDNPTFSEIEASPVFGELETAEQTAEDFLKRRMPFDTSIIQWLQGVPDKNGPVYYANHPKVTLRVRK